MFKTQTFYSLTCDWPGCGAVVDNGEFTYFAETEYLVDQARESGWREGALAMGWYCEEHPAAWESEGDSVAAMVGPYLLIHDDTDDPVHEDGTVTYVENVSDPV